MVPVKIIKINLVDSQTFQTCFTGLSDVLWRAANSAVFAPVEFIPEFGA